jgi:hypothetical protein
MRDRPQRDYSKKKSSRGKVTTFGCVWNTDYANYDEEVTRPLVYIERLSRRGIPTRGAQ